MPIFNDRCEASFLVTKDPAIQQDRIMKLEQQLKNLTADNAYLSSMLDLRDQTIARQADHNRRLQRQCNFLEPKVTNQEVTIRLKRKAITKLQKRALSEFS